MLFEYKKIAIVGSGISGLTSAHLLNQHCDILLFDKNDYVGGHTNTETVTIESKNYDIDTGFIVFNYKTYKNFTQLLKKLDIQVQKSDMSFSFSNEVLEYSGESLNGLFSQRRNLIRPKFYQFLSELYRFNKQARAFLKAPIQLNFGDYIREKCFSSWLENYYLTPMASAIWSMPPESVDKIPTDFILNFYSNHGLLNLVNRIQWYVIKGGSHQYVNKLILPFKDKIKINTAVRSIKRFPEHVLIYTDKHEYKVDAVVLACHSDEALNLLDTPSEHEQSLLSSIPYTSNQVTLHTDINALPRSKRAWASWNYISQADSSTSLTYYMNKLQGIRSETHFCVSVNANHLDPNKVIKRFSYSHPTYSYESVEAKRQHILINNVNRTFFTGAYWGNGFHEDGVTSALNALEPLGVSL